MPNAERDGSIGTSAEGAPSAAAVSVACAAGVSFDGFAVFSAFAVLRSALALPEFANIFEIGVLKRNTVSSTSASAQNI